MQYQEWKARAALELERSYKLWAARVPEHVWRDAYVHGDTPQQAAETAQRHYQDSRPVKLRRNRDKLGRAGAIS